MILLYLVAEPPINNVYYTCGFGSNCNDSLPNNLVYVQFGKKTCR